jgi:hypothetical protein
MTRRRHFAAGSADVTAANARERARTPRLAPAFVAASLLAACQVLVGIGSRDEVAPDVPPAAEASTPEPDAPLTAVDADAPPVCKIGQERCGAACVDTRIDGRHCGACGHSCLGAACQGGECTPELVAPGTVDGAVYVHGDEILFRRAPASGGVGTLAARHVVTQKERTVVGDVRQYMVMSRFGGSAWLLIDNPTRIRLVDVVFGTSSTVYSDPTCPAIRNAVAVGDEIFFSTRGDIRRIRVDGTGFAVLKTITEGVAGAVPSLAVTDGTIYYGAESARALFAMPRSGGASWTVDRGPGEVSFVDVTGGRALWLSRDELRSVPPDAGGDEGGVVDDGGGTADSIVATTTNTPLALAQLREPYLYVADVAFGGASSRVVRVDRRSGEVLVLASGLVDFGVIAVDAQYVYMPRFPVDGGTGIYRIPR